MKVSNKDKVKRILRIMIIVTIAFAWVHSSMGTTESAEESGAVFDLIAPMLRFLLPDAWVTEHFIRKLAHFTEYAALGLELGAYMLITRERIKRLPAPRFFVNVWMTGLFIAFIDETIQIFSGRGPMIADVWVDMSGYSVGMLIISVLML